VAVVSGGGGEGEEERDAGERTAGAKMRIGIRRVCTTSSEGAEGWLLLGYKGGSLVR